MFFYLLIVPYQFFCTCFLKYKLRNHTLEGSAFASNVQHHANSIRLSLCTGLRTRTEMMASGVQCAAAHIRLNFMGHRQSDHIHV